MDEPLDEAAISNLNDLDSEKQSRKEDANAEVLDIKENLSNCRRAESKV